MKKNKEKRCDECGSFFIEGSSAMNNLCPECSFLLYGYPNCKHVFAEGKCQKCDWDGSKSDYANDISKKNLYKNPHSSQT